MGPPILLDGKKLVSSRGDMGTRSLICSYFIPNPPISPAFACGGFGSMAIQSTVVGAIVAYRIHLAVAAALTAAAFSLASVGPSFATVAGFFWPLVVSTVALLGAVAILLRISPLQGEAYGEGLVDFVAGCAEVSQLAASESYHHEGDSEPCDEEAEAEAESEAERPM